MIAAMAAMGAPLALAQTKPAGVPVPEDSPVYNAFRQLEKQPAYHLRMTMESKDPRMAQMAASGMGFAPMEMLVQGGTRQVTMHMRIPATDIRNTIDDWEIRSVVQNGKAARLITSPAVPRLLKLGEAQLQMQMAMLDMQASTAITRAMAGGPMGMMNAGMIAGTTALAHMQAARLEKKAKDFFSWQCVPGAGGGDTSGQKNPNQLTDLRALGDQAVEGTAAAAYEFYTRERDQLRGPVRLYVAKDSGLPMRIEMNDPEGRGSMRMDYYDIGKTAEIEIPPCLANGQ
jgi:hypothetical protein